MSHMLPLLQTDILNGQMFLRWLSAFCLDAVDDQLMAKLATGQTRKQRLN